MKTITIQLESIKEGSLNLYQDLKKELTDQGFKFIQENTFEYDETDLKIRSALYEIFDKYYKVLDKYAF
ncbi:MAG: hypothetical protein ACI3Z5_02990 [Paludibacteraceae bacterium]